MAIRCHILKLKFTKSDFVWGSTPDPFVGAYSAPSDFLAGFKGPTSKGREEPERRGKDGVRRGCLLYTSDAADE